MIKKIKYLYLIPLFYFILFFLKIKNTNIPFINKSYEQFNLIEIFSNNNFFSIDKIYGFRLLELIISFLKINEKIVILLSGVVLILNLILFNLVLKKLGVKSNERFLAVLFLAITPAFISSIFFLNSILLGILFFMIFLLAEKNIFLQTSSLIFSILFWPPSIILIIIDYYRKKDDSKNIRYIYLYILILIFYYLIFLFPNFKNISLYNEVDMINFFAVFGNLLGYSLPIVLLSIISFISAWFSDKKNFLLYICFILLFLASIKFNGFIFLVSYFLSYFASKTLIYLYKRNWELPNIKNMTLFVIICLILFSTLFYITNISRSTPNNNQIEGLKWFSDKEKGIVLSSYENGNIIRYFSNNTPFLDPLNKYEDILKFQDANNIFYSRDLELTKKIFDKYNIKYIYIDNLMKEGDIWTNKDQGLLFLLKNSDNFKNIFNSQGIEIWQYIA